MGGAVASGDVSSRERYIIIAYGLVGGAVASGGRVRVCERLLGPPREKNGIEGLEGKSVHVGGARAGVGLMGGVWKLRGRVWGVQGRCTCEGWARASVGLMGGGSSEEECGTSGKMYVYGRGPSGWRRLGKGTFLTTKPHPYWGGYGGQHTTPLTFNIGDAMLEDLSTPPTRHKTTPTRIWIPRDTTNKIQVLFRTVSVEWKVTQL